MDCPSGQSRFFDYFLYSHAFTPCISFSLPFLVSFPHLLRNIERPSGRTLQSAAPPFLLPAHSENISQTRKPQPAEHLFLIHSTKKCTPAGYFLVHRFVNNDTIYAGCSFESTGLKMQAQPA